MHDSIDLELFVLGASVVILLKKFGAKLSASIPVRDRDDRSRLLLQLQNSPSP